MQGEGREAHKRFDFWEWGRESGSTGLERAVFGNVFYGYISYVCIVLYMYICTYKMSSKYIITM